MDSVVTIAGNLTRAPELRFTPSGVAVCKLDVAVNRRFKDGAGEQRETVSFVEVSVWRDQAENIASCLDKGMRVVVTGNLEQQSWENDQGEKRSKLVVTAHEVGASLLFAQAVVSKVERKAAAPATTGK